MNRSLLIPLAAGLFCTATYAQQSTDTLPPVQAPPPMDQPANTPADKPAVPQAKAHSQMKTDKDAQTVPIANSDADAQADAAAAKKRIVQPVPLLPPEPEKKFDSPGLPPEVQKAAEATELPVITVRQEGANTIEEYRKRGKLFAQRIIPKEGGETKWYVDKRYQGPMPADPAAGVSGHVTPVEYKILEWQ